MSVRELFGFAIVQDPSIPAGELRFVDASGHVVGRIVGIKTWSGEIQVGHKMQSSRAELAAREQEVAELDCTDPESCPFHRPRR